MVAHAPFDPHRFQTAARHYAARPQYSPRLVARVAEATFLTGDDRLMDLGCGPGNLTLAFAPLVGSVVAVDPEPEMLSLAEAAAGEMRRRITLIQGSSNDLGPHFGTFKLVTIGRAFHWMDREDTLRRLDAVIVPEGAIALFDVEQVQTAETGWTTAYREIIERHADGKSTWHGPGVERDEAVLLASPFRRLERFSAIDRLIIDGETLVDRALSMSRTSPGRIGPDGVTTLSAEIRTLVAKVGTDGKLVEVIESEALVAWRPEA
jgi:SAM-dependent methyltransferase